MNNFQREYMGELVESREDRRAFELWCWYHVTTESFDRLTCAYTNERGIAIPTTRNEQAATAQNEARVRRDICEQAQREAISVGVMLRANGRACLLSFEEHRRHARFNPKENANDPASA